MPRKKLNKRNLAIHDILTGDLLSPRPPASIIAQPDASQSRPGGPHLTANDRIRQNAFERDQKRRLEPQGLTLQNLARHDAVMARPEEDLSGYTAVSEEPARDELTLGNLACHDVHMAGIERAPCTGSDVAHDGSDEGWEQHLARNSDPRAHQGSGLLRDQFDYSNIGWAPASRPDGWYGAWEPRAGRRW